MGFGTIAFEATVADLFTAKPVERRYTARFLFFNQQGDVPDEKVSADRSRARGTERFCTWQPTCLRVAACR
jgi:hypothetical protein